MPRTMARAALLVAAASMLAACSAGGQQPTTPIASPGQAVGEAPADGQPVGATPVGDPPIIDLPDGRHPVLIKSVDTSAMTVTFDLVEWLTGQAAMDAFLKENPSDTDGPPNDYWVVNNNPKLRTSGVEEDVVVIIALGGSPTDTEQIPLGQLAQAFDGVLDSRIVWLTLVDGTITTLEQQWVP